MRRIINKAGAHWLFLLLAADIFYAFIAWLSAPDAFLSLVAIILLFTALIVFFGCLADKKTRRRQTEALRAFLAEPDAEQKLRLTAVTDKSFCPMIETMSEQLREQSKEIKEKSLELQSYREFIEAWTHEIKTPLSLATMVLDNHREEMSPYVYNRMEHVRYSVKSDVDRILFYARLQSDHADYKFGRLDIGDCVMECLEDFRGISEEKKIDVRLSLMPLQVVSDRKILAFILSQLFSNAFKYTAQESGVVSAASWQDARDGGKIHLAVRDNGNGVAPEDAPFIFDKGFTGNHPGRQDATGMGLYFVKKYAEALEVEVKIEPFPPGRGFGVELVFPLVS